MARLVLRANAKISVTINKSSTTVLSQTSNQMQRRGTCQGGGLNNTLLCSLDGKSDFFVRSDLNKKHS